MCVIDKSALEISDLLGQYIGAILEEVVVEGKSFDNQKKKYLQRYCKNERIEYSILEKTLIELIEIFEELKSHNSKPLEKYAKILAKDSYLDVKFVDKIILTMNVFREEAEKKATEETENNIKKEVERRVKKEIEIINQAISEQNSEKEKEGKNKEDEERRNRAEYERKVKKEIAELKLKVSSNLQILQETQTKLDACNKNLINERGKNKSLSEQLSKCNLSNENTQTELENLRSRLSRTENLWKKTQSELGEINNQLISAQKKCASLQEMSDQINTQNLSLTKKISQNKLLIVILTILAIILAII